MHPQSHLPNYPHVPDHNAHPGGQLEETPTELRHRVALFGWNGDNGLTGIVKAHHERISTLESLAVELRILWQVARWTALVVSATVALLLSDGLGAVVRKILLLGGVS